MNSKQWYIQRIEDEYDAASARAAYLYPEVSALLDDLEAQQSGFSEWNAEQCAKMIERIRNA